MTHDEIAIEKQTPKALVFVRKLGGIFAEYKCPGCDHGGIITHCTNYPNYCDVCGQRLDWSEFKEVEKQCSD
jgi:ribosomal protein S27E